MSILKVSAPTVRDISQTIDNGLSIYSTPKSLRYIEKSGSLAAPITIKQESAQYITSTIRFEADASFTTLQFYDKLKLLGSVTLDGPHSVGYYTDQGINKVLICQSNATTKCSFFNVTSAVFTLTKEVLLDTT